MSHVVGQNSPTPQGDNNLHFQLTHDNVVHLEAAANCLPASVKQTMFLQFALFLSYEV